MKARTVAVKVLTEVIHIRTSLSQALPKWLLEFDEDRERAFAQELCYGVLRWLPRLEAVLEVLLDKPLRSRDRDIHCLLLIGVYQLLYLRVADHAAVSETVSVVQQLKKTWAKKLVNGVLRQLQRNKDDIINRIDCRPSARFAHPHWLLEQIQQSWPGHWEQIVVANNQRPPMVLRVNLGATTRQGYLDELRKAGIKADVMLHAASAICLKRPVDVSRLPGFRVGKVSIQDTAAQLAAPLLRLAAGQRVLDVCAAPGGKTLHILESEPDLESLVAVDIDGQRLTKLQENLARIGRRRVKIITADAGQASLWWDNEPFDRILLDAPCSASGVIRRHPDIKILRQPTDIKALCIRQQTILDAVWPRLHTGGILLYVTCSILPQENERQIAAFMQQHTDAKHIAIEVGWGIERAFGHQILPGDDNMDGFYYACLEKR